MQNEWQFCLGMHLHPGGRLLFNPGCRCKSENEWLALTLYTFRLNAWMHEWVEQSNLLCHHLPSYILYTFRFERINKYISEKTLQGKIVLGKGPDTPMMGPTAPPHACMPVGTRGQYGLARQQIGRRSQATSSGTLLTGRPPCLGLALRNCHLGFVDVGASHWLRARGKHTLGWDPPMASNDWGTVSRGTTS